MRNGWEDSPTWWGDRCEAEERDRLKRDKMSTLLDDLEEYIEEAEQITRRLKEIRKELEEILNLVTD